MKEGTKSKARRSRPRAVKDRNCDVHIGGESICIYPLDDLLHDLSRRWTLLIIAILGNVDEQSSSGQTSP